jgi:O-antigen/teichoic acid export membrane protein
MSWRPLQQSPKTWVLADQAIVSGSSFVTNILIARALGITDYGKFSVILLIQLFMLSIQQAVSTGVLQVMVLRYDQRERKFYIKGVFYAQCLFFLLLSGICLSLFLIAPTLTTGYPGLFAPALIGTILLLAQDFLRKTLLTLGQERRAFFIDTLTNATQLAVLGLLMITGGLSIAKACWTIGLTFIPSVALGIAWVNPGRPVVPAIRNAFLVHKGQGSWMLLSALLQWFAGNLFVLAAGWWLGLAALGALRLSQYTFGILNVVLQAIENYSLPKASRFLETPAQFNRFLQRVLKKSLVFIVPLLLLVVLFAKPLLSFGGGPAYARYTYVMYGLAATYLLILAGIPVRIALRTKLLNRSYFAGYVLATLFSLLAGKWLIQQWALAGVLTGLFSTQLILLVYWLLVLKTKNVIAWRSSTLY